MALSRVTGIPETPAFTIAILIAICIVYTMAVYFGMKGVARLASSCVGLFFVLLAYFFFGGGEMRYIVETGLTSLGNLSQNFIPLATWTDALRTSSFPQNWTIFYWAYWMVWCVATPFFIGRPFWVDISSDCPAPLLLLSFLEITGCPFRCMEGWI